MAMGKVTKSFKVTLDIARSISNREFSVVEGDTGNTLSITLNDDGKAVDLTGCRVLALFSKSNGETAANFVYCYKIAQNRSVLLEMTGAKC